MVTVSTEGGGTAAGGEIHGAIDGRTDSALDRPTDRHPSSGTTTAETLSIGEVARRAGVSVPTLRFYESKGLLRADRTGGRQRRFPRHVLRRVAVIRAAQRLGLSLAEVGDALAHLPADRAPSRAEWAELSRSWQGMLSDRIEALTRLRDGLGGCIGCGCLSMDNCPIYNADDRLAAEGPGARRLPPAARVR